MTNKTSVRRIGWFLALVAGFAIAASAGAAAPKDTGEGREVAYAELEQHVGEEIEVQTTFGTTRRGVLTGYTTVSISMTLDAEAGSIDLTVPKETVRAVRVLGPAEPAMEGARAKTN